MPIRDSKGGCIPTELRRAASTSQGLREVSFPRFSLTPSPEAAGVKGPRQKGVVGICVGRWEVGGGYGRSRRIESTQLLTSQGSAGNVMSKNTGRRRDRVRVHCHLEWARDTEKIGREGEGRGRRAGRRGGRGQGGGGRGWGRGSGQQTRPASAQVVKALSDEIPAENLMRIQGRM